MTVSPVLTVEYLRRAVMLGLLVTVLGRGPVRVLKWAVWRVGLSKVEVPADS